VPRVPTYDNFQAAPNALPQVRLTSPEIPDVGGQQAQQQQGQSLQRSGGELGRIALDMAKQANELRVNAGTRQAIVARNDLAYGLTEGFVHLRGGDALFRPDNKSLAAEYREKLQKRFDDIETGLGNEAQREAFRLQSSQIMSQFDGALTHHVAREYGTYNYSEQEANIQVARNQMPLAWGDAELLSQSRNVIRASVVEQGRLKGFDSASQWVKAQLVAELSPGHASVIAAAVDAGKLDYAREYLKQANAELTPEARLQATKILDAGNFEARTQDQADAIYSRHKDDIAAALEEARRKLSGKEEDAVVLRLKNYDAERVNLREREQRDAADQGWKLVAQHKRVPPSLLAAMDGRDARAIQRVLTEGVPVKTDVSKWLEFTNLSPATLASITPQQLMRDYRPYFSDGDLRNANQIILAARGVKGEKQNPEGLQLMTTADLLKRTAQELKILPYSRAPDTKEQANYLAFTDRMQVLINEWEAINRKTASPEILRTLLDHEKLNVARYNEWGFDKDRPFITLTPEQQAKAYVLVGNEENKLSSIPLRIRAQIVEALQAKGRTVTEEAIVRLWIKGGRPKK